MSGAEDSQLRLEQLVREYSGLIRRVIAHVCGRSYLDSQLGDDIEQEVFIALWKRLGSEQPIADPSSYIYVMARRETVRVLMREAARRQEPLPEGVDEMPATSETPLATLEARELGRTVEAALQQLPADRQRAVRAHLVGLDAGEIGALTGWPYNRVRNLVSRGMLELRRVLKPEALGD